MTTTQSFAPLAVLVAALAGGVLVFLFVRLTSPSTPKPEAAEEYTFQPEPRRAPINLQESSGGLSGRGGAGTTPSAQTASCASLQDFANQEYEKRQRSGKVSDLIVFKGFERLEANLNNADVVSCSGGSMERRSDQGSLTCENVILNYNTRTNTLSYNIQYVYLARGLQPECSR